MSGHTGCGKTLAYLLPLLQMVLKSVQKEGVGVPHDSPKALILTPSRELAYQIYVRIVTNNNNNNNYYYHNNLNILNI